MSPQEVIESAKELSTVANELARQLREMAAKTQDPVFKEVCSEIPVILTCGRNY